ncbi:MAG: asparagine synthase (glutamine-hydrolyzing), partial [Proteobacteria bacterium]|nr:asparagine synthase (glutamine-hydrolyzing) [Pseudomonadota bacterium]
VFNGEIYNYIELRNELSRRGARFTTTSDTEVLLQAYLAYGTDFVEKLNGMFAFLLHDPRKGILVAARDHFGIKPLYLYHDAERIIFASEVKAILAHPSVRRAVDPHSLDDYLTLQYTLGTATLFKGVRKILPAHVEVFDLRTGRVLAHRYWQPRYQVDHRRTEAEFIDELKFLLADSVHLQMRSDVPVGAYLSGGRDSSAVTMLAARETPHALQTFTGAFHNGPEFDESAYARAVAQACGAVMHLAYPTERDFIDLLPRLSYHMDEPAAGPGLFPQFVVSQMASRHVKVCLGGQGGDEIFGGYARYVVAYLEQALRSAIEGGDHEAGLGVSLGDLGANLGAMRQYLPMLKRFLSKGLLEAPARRYFHLIDRSEGALEAYSAEYCGRYDQNAVFERFKLVFEGVDTPSFFNRMLNYDLLTGLPSLLHVEDRVSMAVSLESRVPLLDVRIVDLVAQVPPSIKFKGGEMKYLFKQAIQDLLPLSVANRQDKMGFPVPLHKWARGAAKDFFHDVLLSQRARERGLFDMKVVAELINQEAAYSRVLWGMLQLELWHREFIDNPQGHPADISGRRETTRTCH